MKAIDELNEIMQHKDYESMVGFDILYTVHSDSTCVSSDEQKSVGWSKIIEISPSGICVKLLNKPCTVELESDTYYRRIQDIDIIEVLEPNT